MRSHTCHSAYHLSRAALMRMRYVRPPSNLRSNGGWLCACVRLPTLVGDSRMHPSGPPTSCFIPHLNSLPSTVVLAAAINNNNSLALAPSAGAAACTRSDTRKLASASLQIPNPLSGRVPRRVTQACTLATSTVGPVTAWTVLSLIMLWLWLLLPFC